MKYIVVTGGVVSGLGKGVTISSIGRMLKNCGLRTTSIKIDPYLVSELCISIDCCSFTLFASCCTTVLSSLVSSTRLYCNTVQNMWLFLLLLVLVKSFLEKSYRY